MDYQIRKADDTSINIFVPNALSLNPPENIRKP